MTTSSDSDPHLYVDSTPFEEAAARLRGLNCRVAENSRSTAGGRTGRSP